MPFIILENGDKIQEKGLTIEAFGNEHAPQYPTLPIAHNTGYFIADKLFFPGDAFTIPSKKVEILALPVSGGWMKLSEAIDYAKKINPSICFPVHYGMLKRITSTNTIPPKILTPLGIKWIVPEDGKLIDFELQ